MKAVRALSFRIQIAVGAVLLARAASAEIREAGRQQQAEQLERAEAGYL